MSPLPTIWVFGDRLQRHRGALAGRQPGECRVLLVVSTAKIASKRWHRQRLHLVVSAMRHFAQELRDEGFDVDLRQAPSLRAGLDDHLAEHDVERVVAMEPMNRTGRAMLEQAGVSLVRNDQFLCHYEDFADWQRAAQDA